MQSALLTLPYSHTLNPPPHTHTHTQCYGQSAPLFHNDSSSISDLHCPFTLYWRKKVRHLVQGQTIITFLIVQQLFTPLKLIQFYVLSEILVLLLVTNIQDKGHQWDI